MNRLNSVALMGNKRRFRCVLVAIAAAGSFAFGANSISPMIGSANAQEVVETLPGRATVNRDSQMLLESDNLTFDNDQQIVIATGNVQIAYNGYTLVADKVIYNRKSGRVLAQGGVEILEPGGNRIFSDEIDLTDDFSDGFIGALNVKTADDTRIAAENAERIDGEFTVFNNAVYTACKACKENPEKPPFWQIRAKKVTINNATRAVEYEDATFEFFGKPVLRMPRFSHADPSVKRKSGFLMPTYETRESLGTGFRSAYFLNLAPNFDLTLAGRYYSRQGFLAEAEWRHRTRNGSYKIIFAGIDQKDSSAFSSSTIDSENDQRTALGTTGAFTINPRWKFGWNALLQSDANFSRTYGISEFSDYEITNEVYLQGLSGKNYLNLAAQDFIIQSNSISDLNPIAPGRQTLGDVQATVLPILDYNIVSDEEDGPGQLSIDLNIANLTRGVAEVVNLGTGTPERFHGIAGDYTRASLNIDWKQSSIMSGGAVVTTALGLRGDGMQVDSENLGTVLNPLTTNGSIFRAMPSAMLEIRYPMIASTSMTTHMFEPIAQFIARPDETHIGLFPNEDAQSFVFDAANLFNPDKYSGYDRVEGGSRANIGFRYSASFETGASIDIVAGQSFHLAGQNSFAQKDLVNAGLDSGLETTRSDYVASLAFNTGRGIVVGTSGRFDEKDFSLRRGEASLGLNSSLFALRTSYIFTEAQPNYAWDVVRHEVKGAASVALNDNWKAYGGVSYDIENGVVIADSIGLAYDDDCYTFSIAYTHSRPRTGESVARTIGFKFGLRTLGGFGYTHQLSSGEDFGDLF